MKRNIETKGRVIRAATGLATVATAIVGFVFDVTIWLTAPLVVFGGFMLFQAASGWCAARACGMKTKY